LSVWNEIILASIFIQTADRLPVMASYLSFIKEFGYRDYGLMSASAVMMVAPVIILFLLLQRRFIEGLTRGGMKF
jgi:raffinose/stachyose/melibiose transport system permease protein